MNWAGGQSLLSGYLAWRRTLSGKALGLDASFAGAPGSDFTAVGQGLARNTGEVCVSLTTQVNERWGWYVNVGTQAARGRSRDVSANAGLRLRF
jgi:outer membrane autotransporter barrel domain